MSASVEIQRNPRKPEARYFVLSGIEPVIDPDQVLVLKSLNDAAEIGSDLAMTLFGQKKPTEIRLYSFNGQDRMAIFFNDPAEWDRAPGKDSNHTVEREIHNLITSSLVTHRKKLIVAAQDESPADAGNATLLEVMEAHLQKIKPPLVNEHGGSVRAKSFDEDKGLLTIQFGQTCASACPASPHGTRILITPRMRSRFPEIKEIVFTNG